MNFLSMLRGSAAVITLIAGIFAAGVKFGPAMAPEQHEAAMIKLAAVFGQDIAPIELPEANLLYARY